MADHVLLEAKNISHDFDVSRPFLQRALAREGRRTLRAADEISFTVRAGTTLALVGESGCGKTTIARIAVGLYRPSSGTMLFAGADLADIQTRQDARRRMNMIFQDPYASLNPRWRVRDLIAEPLRAFSLLSGTTMYDRVTELLAQVGLAASDGQKYPHEFSGGQRQRICIARALSAAPEFLVCDEPTSALDVSVQAQILNLMKDLQRELGLTYLFISHNLAVVRYMADQLGVMYLGRIVEIGAAERIFATPRHPYTRLLLDAVPDPEKVGQARAALEGEVPNPINPPSGCVFHPRCPLANDRCRLERPTQHQAEGIGVACHAVEEGRA